MNKKLGIIFSLFIIFSIGVSGYELQDYPQGFEITGTDKTIVLGNDAAISDIRAANMVLSGLQAVGDQQLITDVKAAFPNVEDDSLELVNPFIIGGAVMDTNLGSYENNMVVIGGPCANEVAAELMGNPTDCTQGFTEGQGRIQVFERDGYSVILVAGLTADDTLAAATVLGEYYNYDLNDKLQIISR